MPLVRTLLFAALLATAATTAVIATLASGRPVPLPDGAGGKLDCASYAPPHFDESARPSSRAEIAADLRLIATRFNCIRTYSTEGIDEVPAAARTAGLRVLLGAWIGSDAKSNRREVERLVSIANANRDVIDTLIVGNEVFLRRDLSVGKLRDLLAEVRRRTGMPVTTADIWAFWPQDPGLLDTVSVVMIHILPYWDDEPESIDTVLPHVEAVYADMVRKFPDKPVMIGETGWPTQGRPRSALEPGRVNAARYIREFTRFAEAKGIRYNLIEAFDQPWKRPNEGTVGGYWGLFDPVSRNEKYPLQGPVAENPDWRRQLGFALAGGLLLPLGGWIVRRRLSFAAGAAYTLSGILAGDILLPQWSYMVYGNRDWLDWCATLAWTSAGWLTTALALGSIIKWLDAPGPDRIPTVRGLRAARFAVLLGAAYVALGLVLAGRHRDFPLPLLAVPVVSLVLLAIVRPARDGLQPGAAETLLGVWLGLAAPLIVWIEGMRNCSALAFATLSITLASVVLVPLYRAKAHADEDQGTGEDAKRRQFESVQDCTDNPGTQREYCEPPVTSQHGADAGNDTDRLVET